MGKAVTFVCVIVLGTLLLAEAVVESESEGVTVEEISVKKTTKPTNNNGSVRRNNGRNTTEENSPTNASSVLVVLRNIADPDDSEPIEPNVSVCAAPPEIEGAITPRLVGAEHALDTAVAYSCNFGYVSRNSIDHISVCRYSEEAGRAQWTTPEIKCIPRSCSDPGYLSNGRRIGNLFTFPNKVEYECDEGYKLKGLRTRYCQAGGDWSGRLPTCEPIYCKVPSDPLNGRVRYSSLEYGIELRYECDVGYMVEKHEPRFCSEDGSWSNEEPKCIETRCEPPQSPEHGSVKLLGELKVGTLATYSCDAGRRLVGATTTKCLITGQWTFDAPQCLSTCTVPFIQSGDLGRFQIRNTRFNTREEFAKVYVGDAIESNEALFLRCKTGYFPAEDSKILEIGRLEVTCIDGMWSRNLQCFKTACDGAPPDTPNGIPDIESRAHGFTIWYHCRRKGMTKVPGNVTCHFGSWIGIPPKCLDNPCYTRDLNFPGLVKPLTEYLESRQNFNIDCENGFRRANSLRKVTCNRGKWDITQSPCIRDFEVDRLVSPAQRGRTPAPTEVPHSVYVTPSNPQIPDVELSRECFCTYDYETDLMKAERGGQPLKRGDSIKQGETVSIECLYPARILTWQNGFRFFGKINMTCNTCEKWQSGDLPDCYTTDPSDVIISSPGEFSVFPGGIVHIPRRQSSRFFCSSTSSQPLWHYDRRGNVIEHADHQVVAGKIIYLTYMDIVGADDDHSGQYVCYTQNVHGHRTTATLELRVDDIFQTNCPFFTPSNGLSVTYTNDNKYSSWAAFSCSANAKLIGNSHSFCERNGTWSYTQPRCDFQIVTNESDIRCPWIEGLGTFGVYYDNHRRINSTAHLMCNEHGKRVEGCSVVTCLPNGTWSGGYPICVDYVSCPRFPYSSELVVKYSNHMSVGSIATFSCSSTARNLIGVDVAVCQEDGRWDNSQPSCEDSVSCPRFPPSEFVVKYSNHQYVGSIATFSCSSPARNLIGDDVAICQEDGRWSNPPPSCADPDCSIGELASSVPEIVEPDMTGINSGFVPSRSEMRLKCSNNCILQGNSNAVCGEDGKWKLGSRYECVTGCVLNIDPSSHLLIHPVQDTYGFGEYVILSCPPGEEMSANVERLMCLGCNWSDSLPFCNESKKNHQP